MSEEEPKTGAKQANLPPIEHQFKPGESGNPNGRPKGAISITAMVKERLKEVYPGRDNAEKKTYAQKIIDAIFDNAIKNNDSRTIKDVWAYIDGQPKATLDIGADKESLSELTDILRAIAKPKEDE